MTRPPVTASLETGPSRETVVAHRFWPVRWMRVAHPEQLAAGMLLAARSLADLAPSVTVTTVAQVGGGADPEAWIGVHTWGEGKDGFHLVESLIRSLVPWVGFATEQAVEELPAVEAAVGMCFDLAHQETDWLPSPSASKLLEVLCRSPGRWQLAVGSGLALHDSPTAADTREGDCFDVSVSLLGSGPEGALAPALLSMDVSLPDDLVTATPRRAADGDLDRLAALGRVGVAPPAGLLGPWTAARLLTIPLRAEGAWPTLRTTPADPRAAADALKATTPPHAVITGGTGQGKTTLLQRWAVETAASEEATLVVVDPHGDLAVKVASSLETRGVPFGVIDLGAEEPLGWNVLDSDDDPRSVARQVTQAIRGLWADMPEEYFGPVWTRATRVLIEILVRDPAGPHPLTRLPEFFSRHSEARNDALERVRDPDLTRSVEEEVLPSITARDAGATALWVTSKLEGLLGNPRVARIVGVSRSDLDLRPILAGRHTVVNAPMGRLGGDGARLLASMLIERIWEAGQRSTLTRPIELFVDEWHRIPSPSIGSLLAEGRKFGFRLRLANQNAAQIPTHLWDTAIANSGAVVVYRTGPKDALLLDPIFPSVPTLTFTQLPKHWAAIATDARDQVVHTLEPIDSHTDQQALARGHQRALAEARRAHLQRLASALVAHRNRQADDPARRRDAAPSAAGVSPHDC